MSYNIPPEIVFEILTRLPVKSLIRFRFVCKPWLRLIDSPSFVNSHLTHSTTTKTNTYILAGYFTNFRAHTIDCVPVIDKSNCVDIESTRISEHNKYSRGDFVGCLNGILCYSFYIAEGEVDGLVSASSEGVDVLLYNPSIRKHYKLPFVSSDYKCSELHEKLNPVPSYGLGYDSANDDYKVVRVDHTWAAYPDGEIVFLSDVKVFSFKSMSWIRAKDFPHPLGCYNRPGQFVSGCLHWFLKPATSPSHKLDDRENLILAFNVGTGHYQLFRQPNCLKENFNSSLVALDGSLSLVCDHMGSVDIWIMKNCGLHESWTKLISVNQCRFVTPLIYSKGGERVLLEKNWEKLVWYDLKSKSVKKTGVRGTQQFAQDSTVYVESLVQLPCPRKVTLQDEQKMKRRNTKKRDDFLSKGFKLVL